MKVVTAQQMREIDRLTIEQTGIPSVVLMERAGVAVAQHVKELFSSGDILVLCGGGNNGGDGIVAARELYNEGFDIKIFIFSAPEDLSKDCRFQYEIATRLGIKTEFKSALSASELDGSIVIDALLGTGLKSKVKDNLANVIDVVNKAHGAVLSVDIASGISSDNGHMMGSAIMAKWTVTFGLPKRGHLLYPGKEHTGQLFIENIGFPQAFLGSDQIKCEIVESEMMSMLVPQRQANSYKGAYGHVLVIGGAQGKTGAALLAARAALKTGSGLVTLAVPESLMNVYQSRVLEEMILPLQDDGKGGFSGKAVERILEFVNEKCDCIAMGPGMGVSNDTVEIVGELTEHSSVPIVLDADGINSLSVLQYPQRLSLLNTSHSPMILTPHTGEMARLIMEDNNDFESMCELINSDRISHVASFGADSTSYLALKGVPTVTTDPEGRTFINPTGSPAMAKGGSGDVLTGMIASLTGQGLPPLFSTVLGAFVHGICGEIAADKNGVNSTVAGDLIEHIAQAYSLLTGGSTRQE